MSRQYNPAVAAYARMDIEGFAKLEQQNSKPTKEGNGLLTRTKASSNNNSEIDYSNPAARVAKQMMAIRKYRDDINGS